MFSRVTGAGTVELTIRSVRQSICEVQNYTGEYPDALVMSSDHLDQVLNSVHFLGEVSSVTNIGGIRIFPYGTEMMGIHAALQLQSEGKRVLFFR